MSREDVNRELEISAYHAETSDINENLAKLEKELQRLRTRLEPVLRLNQAVAIGADSEAEYPADVDPSSQLIRFLRQTKKQISHFINDVKELNDRAEL